MLKGVTPRLYQERVFASCVSKNCLVVLPTGMGKTLVSIMLAVQRLKQYPQSKILFLSPTKPLVEQHHTTFKQFFDISEDKMHVFTGNIKPEVRAALWEEKQVIFSTPQGLENDILSSKISMKNVSLLVFDEAHRAVGDYAYVFLAKRFSQESRFPRILALTASPGSDLESITEVCKHLYIEHVEIRSDEDPDVKPYIQDVKLRWEEVDLPEKFLEIKKQLEQCYKSKLIEVQAFGYIERIDMRKTDLLRLQGQLQAKIAQGERDMELLRSISLLAEGLKVRRS